MGLADGLDALGVFGAVLTRGDHLPVLGLLGLGVGDVPVVAEEGGDLRAAAHLVIEGVEGRSDAGFHHGLDPAKPRLISSIQSQEIQAFGQGVFGGHVVLSITAPRRGVVCREASNS